jgi:hypothetical protein
MKNLSQFKVVKDNPDHYVMRHPDGTDFHVAKAYLSEDMHKQVKQYCMGGEAHYAEGTADAEPEDEADPAGTEDAAPVLTEQSPGQAIPGAAQITAEALPQFTSALKEQKQAAQQQAKAVGQEAEETAPILENTATDLNDLQVSDADRQAQLQQDSDRFKTDIAKGNIDPNRLYNNMSTGQKVATSIGLILGGLGAIGTNGRNVVLDHLNKLVAQDVDAQKANLANKNSLFHLNLEQSGDERQASLLTQRQLLDATQVQLQAAATKASDPKAKAAALQASGQIDMQKAQLDNSMKLLQWQRQLATQPFKKEALGLLTPEQQKRAVILPDGQTAVLANDEKSANDARTAVTTTQPLLNTLDQIEKIRSAVIPVGQKAEQVRSLIPSALLQLKQAQKLGRLSPEAMKLLEQQFSDPTSLVDAVRGPAKTKQLKATLQNQMYQQLQSAAPGFQNPNAVPGAVPKYGQ